MEENAKNPSNEVSEKSRACVTTTPDSAVRAIAAKTAAMKVIAKSSRKEIRGRSRLRRIGSSDGGFMG